MTAAFMLLQLNLMGTAADARALHDSIHAVAGVKTVHFVAGPTDMIVFLETQDLHTLMEAAGKIRSLKGVSSSDTRIVLPM